MPYTTQRYLTSEPRRANVGRNVLTAVLFIVLAGWLSGARAQGNEVVDLFSEANDVTPSGLSPWFGFNVMMDGNEWCTYGPTLPQTFLLPMVDKDGQQMPWDTVPLPPNSTAVQRDGTTAAGEPQDNDIPISEMTYEQMFARGLVPPLPEFVNVRVRKPITPADVEFPEPIMGGVADRVIVAASEGDDEEAPVALNESDEEFPVPIMSNVADRVIVAGSEGDDDVVPADTDAVDIANSVATAGAFNIFIKAKKTVLEPDGTQSEQPVAAQPFKLFFPPGALPSVAAEKPQVGFDEDPIQGVTDDEGLVGLALIERNFAQHLRAEAETQSIAELLREWQSSPPQYEIDVDAIKSFVLEGVSGTTVSEMLEVMPNDISQYLHQGQVIGDIPFVSLTYPESAAPTVDPILQNLGNVDWLIIEENFCRTKQTPNDPSFVQTASRGKSGSWGQPYDDQWAIKRVGLTADEDSAWNNLGDNPKPVTVAVIDTGLDWNHLDISWDNIWKNDAEIPNNQVDDDGNGYIDDVIGWDFMGAGNLPWDYDGHGTIVSGIISATQNNDVGIAGINPYSKLMVLKALNAFGNTRASYIAESIVYAADNGARLVNISVGGEKLSRIERAAVDYANEKGVLIIAAAGNEGQSLEDYGPAGLEGVLTVAATDLQDARTIFSNWGRQVDIAAPGIDILSLRARRTDTMLDIPDVEYVRAANYVGDDKRYYRVSGTSFAAPIVTGIASLVLSKQPDLSHEELHRIITQSADDADIPGKDQFTGYGIVNASAALSLDRDYYIDSLISGASVVQQDGTVLLAVAGTANANDFESAWIEIGAGSEPTEWKRVATDIEAPVIDGTLGMIPATEFAGSSEWVLRLVTEHDDGTRREAWFLLSLG